MLKSKALFAALLLTLSFNTFAICVHNQTSKPIYLSPGEDCKPKFKKIVPGDKYCTKEKYCTIEDEPGIGYSIFDTKYPSDVSHIICSALWTNLGLNDIYVVPDGENLTCILS